MRIRKFSEEAENLKVPEEVVVRIVEKLINANKLHGIIDKENKEFILYTPEELEDLSRHLNSESITIDELTRKLDIKHDQVVLVIDNLLNGDRVKGAITKDGRFIPEIVIKKEMDDYKKTVERLATLFSKGEISEESYKASIRFLEEKKDSHFVGEYSVKVESGYELYGEFLKVGIKIVNSTETAMLNSSILVDIPDALTFVDPDKPFLKLGNIMPNEFQSAIYKLKPMRCVEGEIRGTLNYSDASGQRHTLEVPSIHVRSICPFLTGEGVVVADWMDMLNGGLLDSKSECFEFKGSPKVAFSLAEDRVRHLKLVERDEKTIDGIYCGYCCYFGNAKYGGYYFATIIFVSGGETKGRLTLTVHSNHSDIFTGYFYEVLEDVRKHVETAHGISVITGKCPECGGELDPSEADKRGVIKCSHCRCLNVIPPWMRAK